MRSDPPSSVIPAQAGIVLLVACLGLFACSRAQVPIEIQHARSPAMPPGSSAIAVYADLVANHADTLLSVTTPVAETADMHVTEEHAGMMQMRPVAEVVLAAGETVRFEPGGKHIMLGGVRQVLPVGTQFPLTLHFAVAGDMHVQVKVVGPGMDSEDSP